MEDEQHKYFFVLRLIEKIWYIEASERPFYKRDDFCAP